LNSKYFDTHWEKNGNEIPNKKLKVAEEFLQPILNTSVDKLINGSTKVLDVGCGDGVHYTVLKNSGFGAQYLGIDISENVINTLNKAFGNEEFTSFELADAVDLAYEDCSFDIVFAFGVLGYTSAPEKSFSEMVRVLKPNGKIGIWLYPKKRGFLSTLFKLTRTLVTSSNETIKSIIANCIIPFLYILPTRSGINLSNSTWAQCKEVVLVNIAPAELMFFSKTEICNWFTTRNLNILEDDVSNPITIWAEKTDI
jgi:SAM-dependent methyltransferase